MIQYDFGMYRCVLLIISVNFHLQQLCDTYIKPLDNANLTQVGELNLASLDLQTALIRLEEEQQR